jgi:hypothetical protein
VEFTWGSQVEKTPKEKKRSDATTAAYVTGAFLLVGIVLTAVLRPAVPIILRLLSRKPSSGIVLRPAGLSDEALKAEGCDSPRDGKCFACEKDAHFANQGERNTVARLTCLDMPGDMDARASFKGVVVTDNPPPTQGISGTDVCIAIGFRGSPATPLDHISPKSRAVFNVEAEQKSPHAKTLEAYLTLVTCQSGASKDSCSTDSNTAVIRIEAIPGGGTNP